jgi:DNA ligase (NAD+)
VALLRPVDVGGVTVSRATLHNRAEIERCDRRVGDTVQIARAGDVIPEIVRRVPRRGARRGARFRMPARCPACASTIVEQGPLTVCPNAFACPAQLKRAIEHLGSDIAFDIPGLGRATAEALVERGLVGALPDVFRLRAGDIERLPGFAARSAQNLARAIASRRTVQLSRFLTALGIPGVGAARAQELAEQFGSLAALRAAPAPTIASVPGLGTESARAIRAFFDDRRNARIVDGLLTAGVRVSSVGTAHEGALAGRRFVFTGTLPTLTRHEAARMVEARGATVSDRVSARTDYVVAGRRPGAKLARARERGARVLDAAAFRELLGVE